MTGPTRLEHNDLEHERTPEQLAAIKAVAAWVQQFARALKNCRLYDAANPNVGRFRLETAVVLRQLLDQHGEVVLRIGSDDMLFDGASVHPRSDENLALPFYRDGVRALILSPGVETAEVEAMIDAVLQVTGPQPGD